MGPNEGNHSGLVALKVYRNKPPLDLVPLGADILLRYGPQYKGRDTPPFKPGEERKRASTEYQKFS